MSATSNEPGCSHIGHINAVPPAGRVCDQCVAMGDQWVHLRTCLSCGRVGCCDQSKNQHATKHYQQTSHPLIQSMEPGEDWIYCYVDDVGMEPPRGFRKK